MNSNGSGNPLQLTEHLDDRATDSYYKQLLFASKSSGNWEIYMIPTVGGVATNLTNNPSQDVGATYSPDGKYIAFMSDRDGIWGIWIMQTDGSDPHKLIDVPNGFGSNWMDESLAWGS